MISIVIFMSRETLRRKLKKVNALSNRVNADLQDIKYRKYFSAGIRENLRPDKFK
ncbi:MAG: hypothetical protein Q8O04_02870 [Deltaproteobacteria bacterium]|nr:hypothetical protein [Deltaproteobacteria bacterium]